MPPKAKRWCFTLNNPTEGEKQALADLLNSDHVSYAVVGRETGEGGTPHLQGYLIWETEKRFTACKQLVGARYHLEVSRGTPKQASDYCKKDGDFDEYGECPGSGNQGKRTDWERLKEWCAEQTEIPSDFELFSAFPSLYGRYKKSVREICNLCIRVDSREVGNLRDGWQRDLEQRLNAQPDDRSIIFVVDEEGNQGKTWFVNYMMKKHPQDAQRLKAAKRDDMAHFLIPGKRFYFIDVPRGGMELFQYSVAEMIKDKAIFSPKYESHMKTWDTPSHCIIMCNEQPNMNALSRDRYEIIDITPPRAPTFILGPGN